MNKIIFALFAAAFCLVLLQIEIILLFSLQAAPLKTWDAQIRFNQSVIDVLNMCTNKL